jgi:hypothetical protein
LIVNAIVQFAGPIAEGRRKKDRTCAHDFDYAAKMIRHISRTRNESRANWKRLWEQTEILVSDHRASIEAVSRELLIRRRLSYRDVTKIVTPRRASTNDKAEPRGSASPLLDLMKEKA